MGGMAVSSRERCAADETGGSKTVGAAGSSKFGGRGSSAKVLPAPSGRSGLSLRPELVVDYFPKFTENSRTNTGSASGELKGNTTAGVSAAAPEVLGAQSFLP